MTSGITNQSQWVEGTASATLTTSAMTSMKEPSVPPAAAGGTLLDSTPSSQKAASLISSSAVKKVADVTAM